MQLPFVLQSAETMKASVAYLEPHMEKAEGGGGKGRIVLATVKGDVHDIGKNLVDIILTNNGYEVHNIGIKVSIAEMIEKALEVEGRRHRHERPAREVHADHARQPRGAEQPRARRTSRCCSAAPPSPAPTSSATCARSTRAASSTARTRSRACASWTASARSSATPTADDPDWGRVPVRLDGARSRGRFASGDGDDSRSTCPTARPSRGRQPDLRAAVHRLEGRQGHRPRRHRRLHQRDGAVPQPVAVPPREGAARSDDEFKERIRPHAARAAGRRPSADDLLVPEVVYGYWPCNGDGDDLVVWEDETRDREVDPLPVPPASKEPYLCIADFFRPIESAEVDYVAFHIVTMGAAVSERTAELFAADKYQDYLLLHGLGVEMAEALAEFWHRRIREEWGFADEDGPTLAGLFRQQYRGGRYSWGYPACPDLEDNEKVAELLGADRIGIEVSEETGFQYQPEQTTCAIICHHPKAKYFVAR